MSNLLSQASLVMIPSGYKEDVVYSQIPTDGSGDLAFTRTSNGTRINSAGLVEVCPWNLIDNSNSFTSGAWILQEVTSTSGQSDPLGGNFGWRFNETTATNQHRFYYAFIAFNTGVVTQSIYVKSLGRDQIFIGANSNAESFIFTFSTETISSVTGFTSTSATSVGGGWYRLTATFFGFSPINCLFVQGYNGGLSYAGDTSKGFYAFGGQLNIGSTAKPYFPTTDRLNVPRLTYQNGGGGCPSLLLEKQSTNLAVYSEQFDNGAWPKQNLTVTANATTSPDGTQNADKLIADITNARHLIYQAFSVSANTYTFTTYAKAGENSFLIMRLDTDIPEVKTWFDLSNGTIGTSQGGSPTITSVGNGWYRCSVQYVASTSLTLYGVLYTAKTNGSENFAGNGTDGTYVWGAQLEASSYATSYIPTTSSSATRVADACYKTGISSLIGQTEGTLYWDGVAVQGNYNQLMFIKDSSVNQFIGMTVGTGVIYGEIYNGGYVHLYSYSIGANDTRFKMALAYKTNSFAFYVNGVQVASSTTGTTPTSFDDFYLGNTNNLRDLNCQVNEAVIFPTRLTNAELQAITTI